MRGILLKLLAMPAAALAMSCAVLAPSIPVIGTPADLERLAGKWFGEYVGDVDASRRGTIAFELASGRSLARGDVMMTPEGHDRPYWRYRGDETGSPPRNLAQVPRALTINFVRTHDGTLEGLLDPYWDPERQTQAVTMFYGRLADDRIDGIFRTTFENGAAAMTGRWRVSRER